MNGLTVLNHDGRLVVDSREVAAMVGKRHDHLMRGIGTYIIYLNKSTDPKFGASDFFITST